MNSRNQGQSDSSRSYKPRAAESLEGPDGQGRPGPAPAPSENDESSEEEVGRDGWWDEDDDEDDVEDEAEQWVDSDGQPLAGDDWEELTLAAQRGGLEGGAAVVAACSYLDRALKWRFGKLEDEHFKRRLDRAIAAGFLSEPYAVTAARELRDEFCHSAWLPNSREATLSVRAAAVSWFEVAHRQEDRPPPKIEVDRFLGDLSRSSAPVQGRARGVHAGCTDFWIGELKSAASSDASLVRAGAVLAAAGLLDIALIEALGENCRMLSVRGKLEQARLSGLISEEDENLVAEHLKLRNRLAHSDERLEADASTETVKVLTTLAAALPEEEWDAVEAVGVPTTMTSGAVEIDVPGGLRQYEIDRGGLIKAAPLPGGGLGGIVASIVVGLPVLAGGALVYAGFALVAAIVLGALVWALSHGKYGPDDVMRVLGYFGDVAIGSIIVGLLVAAGHENQMAHEKLREQLLGLRVQAEQEMGRLPLVLEALDKIDRRQPQKRGLLTPHVVTVLIIAVVAATGALLSWAGESSSSTSKGARDVHQSSDPANGLIGTTTNQPVSPPALPAGQIARDEAARPREDMNVAGPNLARGEEKTDAYKLNNSAYKTYKRGDVPDAEQTLARALAANPWPWTRAAIYYNLGLIARNVGDAPSAIALFGKSLRQRPRGPSSDIVRRDCAEVLGRSCGGINPREP